MEAHAIRKEDLSVYDPREGFRFLDSFPIKGNSIWKHTINPNYQHRM